MDRVESISKKRKKRAEREKIASHYYGGLPRDLTMLVLRCVSDVNQCEAFGVREATMAGQELPLVKAEECFIAITPRDFPEAFRFREKAVEIRGS